MFSGTMLCTNVMFPLWQTYENSRYAHFPEPYFCFKVQNAHFKLASPDSGQVIKVVHGYILIFTLHQFLKDLFIAQQTCTRTN